MGVQGDALFAAGEGVGSGGVKVMLAPDPTTFCEASLRTYPGETWDALHLYKGATMPKAYEYMRDKFKREGLSDKAAKEKAAKIYNSKHPSIPVTGKHHSSKRK